MNKHLVPFITAFKGNARIIIPGVTACIECTLDLFPPQVFGIIFKDFVK